MHAAVGADDEAYFHLQAGVGRSEDGIGVVSASGGWVCSHRERLLVWGTSANSELWTELLRNRASRDARGAVVETRTAAGDAEAIAIAGNRGSSNKDQKLRRARGFIRRSLEKLGGQCTPI